MPKTTERVAAAADTAKPYVDRALHDEELRSHVKQAYSAARDIYDELIAPRSVVTAAQRVAGDEEIQDNLRVAIAELRQAATRFQSAPRKKHPGRMLILLIGVAVGLLFNPVTGPETRRWVKDKLFGGEDEFGFDEQSGNGGMGAA
jgi:predicted RNA-binding protein